MYTYIELHKENPQSTTTNPKGETRTNTGTIKRVQIRVNMLQH